MATATGTVNSTKAKPTKVTKPQGAAIYESMMRKTYAQLQVVLPTETKAATFESAYYAVKTLVTNEAARAARKLGNGNNKFDYGRFSQVFIEAYGTISEPKCSLEDLVYAGGKLSPLVAESPNPLVKLLEINSEEYARLGLQSAIQSMLKAGAVKSPTATNNQSEDALERALRNLDVSAAVEEDALEEEEETPIESVEEEEVEEEIQEDSLEEDEESLDEEEDPLDEEEDSLI